MPVAIPPSTQILFSSIGVLAFLGKRRSSAKAEAPVRNTEPEVTAPVEKTAAELELEALRAINQVRLVELNEVGVPIEKQTAGVYGFTHAPVREIPLFREKRFRGFEVHKLPNGEVHIVGFVTQAEAAALSSATGDFVLNLYPDPWEESAQAVSVPLSRVFETRGPSRGPGNVLTLKVAPSSEIPIEV
jgi:hypothetical protein